MRSQWAALCLWSQAFCLQLSETVKLGSHPTLCIRYSDARHGILLSVAGSMYRAVGIPLVLNCTGWIIFYYYFLHQRIACICLSHKSSDFFSENVWGGKGSMGWPSHNFSITFTGYCFRFYVSGASQAEVDRHGNWPRIRGFLLKKKMSAPKNKTVRSN